MTATYTFDVFCTLDGSGSYTSSGDWGGYWSKEGPELVAPPRRGARERMSGWSSARTPPAFRRS